MVHLAERAAGEGGVGGGEEAGRGAKRPRAGVACWPRLALQVYTLRALGARSTWPPLDLAHILVRRVPRGYSPAPGNLLSAGRAQVAGVGTARPARPRQ